MARPLKDGVDYFPIDTGFFQNDKVKLLRAEFGPKGMYLLFYLLCELYEKKGYYMQWDDDKCYLVSDGAGCGCSPEFVKEFVAGCIRRSYFDERVFNSFGVLTSSGIQRRFVRMLTSREEFTFFEEYFLLDLSDRKDIPAGILNKLTFKKINSKENSVICGENPNKNTDNTQSRGEENKLDEIKAEESRVDAAAAIAYYKANIGEISPQIRKELYAWLSKVDESLIIYAMEQAVIYNKLNWSYINAILDNHAIKGRKTRWEAEQHPKQLNNSGQYDFDEFDKMAFDKIKNG